jgi:DNA (cytosine-5)-methyltransferase 1
MAANHWQLAVDTHNANHPTTLHDCTDISQTNPRRYPRTDLLWASPECTTHSRARGHKEDRQPDLFGDTLPDEAAERSRATMWDVVRFAEVHGYRGVIVENVIEVTKWLPFGAWLAAMHSLGYEHRIVSLNSMHAQAQGLPAPQSRDRVYIVFWRGGNRRPDLERMQRPRAWCPRCERIVESRQAWKPGRTVGRYRQQYVYRCPDCHTQVEPGWLPAATAIDWSIPGTRIGDRERPLAEKTRRRIAAGIARYWGPLVTPSGGTWNKDARPIDEALRSLTTREAYGLAVPVEGREGKEARPLTDPLRTQTTRLETALAFMPFIAELRGGGSDARTVAEALATICAGGRHHGLVSPYYGCSDTARTTSDALGTLTTRDRYALITRHYTSQGDGAEMTTPITEALRTLTTTAQQSLVTPGDMAAAEAQVDDCLFRMLEPHEVAAGMAFPGGYIWRGNRRERVRLAGNAVTPPAARDLVSALAEAITGEMS